jgi:triosephosphate isomerase
MKKLIVGNWKMNPETSDEAKKIVDGISKISKNAKKTEIVVCPPILFISEVVKASKNKKISIGAQDAFYEPKGAYTGSISVDMLKRVGVKYVILGHSERRALGETDELVNKKIKVCLKSKVTPIVCVGEKTRDAHGYYLAFIKKEIENSLVGIKRNELKDIVVAYEPVWAVGNKSFKAIEAGDLYEMVIYIRRTLSDLFGQNAAQSVRILYGGSVNKENAGEFFYGGGLSGLLVGRDSLDVKKFSEIISLTEEAALIK